MNRYKFALAIFFILLSFFLKAQTPSSTNGTPSENFVGESMCFDAVITNSGGPGYGPYMRVILPPDITFNSASFLGNALSITPFTGTNVFDGVSDLVDPVTDEPITAADLIAAGHAAGSVVTVFKLPVGSVVADGIPLELEICTNISTSATVGVALPVSVQPVYEFGDTPTGSNGPIDGFTVTSNVTPILYRVTKTNNAPLGDRPPGPSWPIEYTISVDVANGQTITDMTITDVLPADLQFVSVVSSPAGFTPDPAALFDPAGALRTSPGGTITIENTTTGVTGTTASGEIEFTYEAYITDILNPANCNTSNLINNASFDASFLGNPQPVTTASSEVEATHITMVESASPTSIQPGNTVTYTLNYRVEDYAAGAGGQISVAIPDGLDYNAAGLVSAPVGVTEASVTGPIAGVTTVVYNIPAGSMNTGTEYTIQYQVIVLQNYAADGAFTGAAVLANDSFTNNVELTYDMAGGAVGCTYNKFGTTISVPEITIDKQVISSGPYSPGDNVTYRLSMTIPSGDSKGIFFEDFFPLPVIDVNTLDLTTDLAANTDISFAPAVNNDMASNPTSITIDAAKNSLRLEWPDVTNISGPFTIAIDIDAEITTDPFANGLIHSNFLRAGTENSVADAASAVNLVAIEIGAPDLTITKGIKSSDNSDSDATISPSAATLPIDGDIEDADAGDELTYVITIENTGDARAYDLNIKDIINPAGSLTNYNVLTIRDGNGGDISGDFIGTVLGAGSDLFTATGLDMNSATTVFIAPNDNSANIGLDMVVIEYTADIDISVQPEERFANGASTSWSASPGYAVRFEEVVDSAVVTVLTPDISKTGLATKKWTIR